MNKFLLLVVMFNAAVSLYAVGFHLVSTPSRATASGSTLSSGLVTTDSYDGPQTYTLVWSKEKLQEMEAWQRAAGVFDESDSMIPPLSAAELSMVLTTNLWRRDKKHLPPMKVDPALMKASREAACSADHQFNGKWGNQRAKEAGFKGQAWDNTAPGPYETPEDAVRGWGKPEKSDWTHADQMAGYYRVNGIKYDGHYNRMGAGACGKRFVSFYGRLTSDVYAPLATK